MAWHERSAGVWNLADLVAAVPAVALNQVIVVLPWRSSSSK
jgi:hypothetical protein